MIEATSVKFVFHQIFSIWCHVALILANLFKNRVDSDSVAAQLLILIPWELHLHSPPQLMILMRISLYTENGSLGLIRLI